MSKISRYADGVMEAAWLAAVIVVPVFFNVYSSRIFEPDKISLLRTLALVILAAWLVKLIEAGGIRWETVPHQGGMLRSLLRIPLLAPVLALAVVYLVSTLFSVAPRISLWGSYQRLQGTYTTLSYLVVFAAILGNLRKRAQVERLITTAILTSLPVSLYGVLQRYQIDPVPWGGNVARRIASNMGNSIFVAAFLIMASPLTVGRIVDSFGAILKESGNLLAQFTRATIYVFIAALQLIALYLSGSRGPLLGWLAGSFFLFVLLSLHWRKRWMTIGIVSFAVLVAGFLVLINVPNGPLERLRDSPTIGRYSRILDMDQRTSRVRILIWQGAAQLVFPHAPLEFPDGETDRWNFLRPLIGYGPESMHVAYNPFFPPELADIEKRNASPDRSHNETWDALVTTGFLGLVVYLILFAVIFYYGLKWLGMLTTRRQRNLFLLLYLGGGALGGGGLVLWGGIEFFGVGLPFGIVIGMIAYLTLIALSARYDPPHSEGGRARALTLMMLLAAIVAHFVEIHFGIAIAATRTYFWTFAALLLVVGYVLPRVDEYGATVAARVKEATPVAAKEHEAGGRGARKRRRRGERDPRGGLQLGKYRAGLVSGLILAVLLATMGYDFINVQSGGTSALNTIWYSFTRLPNKDGAISYGVLTMLLTVWLAAAFIFTSEHAAREDGEPAWQDLLVTLGVSGGLAGLFWLWHAGWLLTIAGTAVATTDDLMRQAAHFEGLLTRYTANLLLVVLLLAGCLPDQWPQRLVGRSGVGALAAPAALVVALAFGFATNVRIVQADVAYKLADPFARSRQYAGAIALYQRATDLAPDEDFYYLFLGKSYLESAQTLQDAGQQDQQIKQAEKTLEEAQALNPLNTDHTANLARLYRWWSSRADDASLRKQRAETSADYYARALTLSPNNVGLWGEWASLYLTVLNQPEEAYERLTHSLELDPSYEVTYGMLGDYYVLESRKEQDAQARQEDLRAAAEQYRLAIENASSGNRQSLYNFQVALGGVYVELGQQQDAINAYQEALKASAKGAEVWRIQETLARLYAQIGDRNNALNYARAALTASPEDEKQRLQTLVAQLSGGP